jgi:SAM-dependent methyltransferase
MARSFDQVAAIYDATRAMPPDATAAIAVGMQRLVAATPATTWLEVGIGTGRIALPLVQAGYRYTGIDPALLMLHGAQQKVAGQQHRLGLACADACALPFADATFDVGVVVHVLHLIPAWRMALTELLRTIRPGGYLLYGYDHGAGGGSLREIGQQWRTLLAARGVTLRNHNAVDEEVAAALRERGIEPTTHRLATWTTSGTPATLLTGYASRAYSSSWSIPDTVFLEAVRDLTTWAQQRYPDPTITLTAELGFSVMAVRCG